MLVVTLLVQVPTYLCTYQRSNLTCARVVARASEDSSDACYHPTCALVFTCAGENSSDGSLGSLKGFEFDTLVSRKPHLRQELLTLRDHLSSQDEEEIKVWEMCGVGG